MHGRKNVSGLVSFSVNFILFLMVLVVCWLWWWVSDLVVIVVLVVIRWYPLVYIYHFLCVTVIVVAVCSIATVRWWLSWFCLSNIEISFKTLMMLHVLLVRRFRDFRSRNLIFVSLICWGADFLVLFFWCENELRYWKCCWFSFQTGRSKERFFTFDSQTLQCFSSWIALVSFGSVRCVVFESFRCFIVCGWCWFTNERWYGLWSVVWWKVQYLVGLVVFLVVGYCVILWYVLLAKFLTFGFMVYVSFCRLYTFRCDLLL